MKKRRAKALRFNGKLGFNALGDKDGFYYYFFFSFFSFQIDANRLDGLPLFEI
ncbi:hypothetical protein IKX64_02970 [Candidatus Saccharibacteria bacterium]|nr:hypothetical protein [Candidatus Saccharibacteria bacterium]